MYDKLARLTPGQQSLSAAAENAKTDEIARLGKLTMDSGAPPGTAIESGATGIQITLPPGSRSFWARLTDRDYLTGKYGWREVLRADGEFYDFDGARSGTLDDGPASEINVGSGGKAIPYGGSGSGGQGVYVLMQTAQGHHDFVFDATSSQVAFVRATSSTPVQFNFFPAKLMAITVNNNTVTRFEAEDVFLYILE